MLKKYWKFTLVFAIILILHLFAVSGKSQVLIFITRPLITISLILFFISATSLKGRFHKRLLYGLVFALVGDVFLLFVNRSPEFLTFGWFAYLLCNLFYISAFYLDFRSAPNLDKKTARFVVFFVALLATGYFFYLRPYLDGFRIPVLIYILVVSFMMMMATFRNQRVNAISFWIIVAGTFLFILSDILVAYNSFVFPFDHSGCFLLITYSLAQYFITIGGTERRLLTQP